jgi:predicted acyltransferase (DUF342 family)
MSENVKETVIAKGTQFDGAIKSDCGVTLAGKLKGEISAPSLKVEASGAVDGRVEVTNLQSEGEVTGQIIAENVSLSGRVGNKTVILAGTLEVKISEPNEGLQVSFGDCELQVGQSATHGNKASDEASELRDQKAKVPATPNSGGL